MANIILTTRKINEILEDRRLTRTEFSKMLNYQTSYVSRILNMKKGLSLEFLIRSAEVLEVTVAELIDEVRI